MAATSSFSNISIQPCQNQSGNSRLTSGIARRPHRRSSHRSPSSFPSDRYDLDTVSLNSHRRSSDSAIIVSSKADHAACSNTSSPSSGSRVIANCLTPRRVSEIIRNHPGSDPTDRFTDMYHTTPPHSYPPASGPSRYYQPPPSLHPPPLHQAYIPRTPGMDPNVFTAPPESPTSPFLPHTPHHAGSGSSSSSYRPMGSSYSSNHGHYLPSSTAGYDTKPQISSLGTYGSIPQVASPSMLTTSLLPTPDEQHVVIHELIPHEGSQGTHISIKCDVNFPTPPPSVAGSPINGPRSAGRALRVVFGNHPVQTQVMMLSGRMAGRGQMCQLSAVVPSWSSTGASGMGRGSIIPIYVQVLDGTHAIVETIHSGEFTYLSTGPKGPQYVGYGPGATNALKRGGDSLESNRPSPSQYLHRRVLSHGNFEPPDYSQMAPPSYSPVPEPIQYSSPYTPSTSTMPSGPPRDGYSPTPQQPNLMRSTQIQPVGLSVPVATYGTAPSTGTAKAKLELASDLDLMSKGWSQEEWMNRRRLVQFWRRQEGTTIHAAFRPVSQQEYPQAQQSIIISCIFREDKNECFVTSVDAIYLLEALVGTRFTVEEKNRIRRNLEGFRPITVSKNKAGSEDFFKLIMGFPNPKPRNIEKDVKVFPWDILSSALKKIIGKYSASYPYPSGRFNSAHSSPHSTPQPYVPTPLPAPLPFQEPYGPPSVIAASSAPPLVSHSSSDSSSTYADATYAPQVPETPRTNSIPQSSDSPTHYRSVSNPHTATPSEKIACATQAPEYVNYSPTDPYNSTTAGGYWAGEGSVGSYPIQGDIYDPPQLPHVHESHSRQPSSNDLRVVYPALAQ